ncbi:GTP-binding protein [Pseudotenacibaculum haliotis]|uniref:GTP-binding protein n=1 Tax=Pseudotenacibaculum haliotis TaxID=1862138 RepID=A0ABW5LX43_9FLAO
MSISENDILLRPRFKLDLKKDKEELLRAFLNARETEATPFLIKVVDAHIFIDVLEDDSHFWSPQLHLEIVEEEEKSVQLKGLFGPKPQVWTFFMFLHFIVASAFIGCGIWAYVNSTLDKTSVFPIVMLIVLPLIWGLLYVLGSLGKDFGKKEMKKMHAFMIATLQI